MLELGHRVCSGLTVAPARCHLSVCVRVCSRSAVDAFRVNVIAAKKVGVPIVYLDKHSFLYSRVGDVFIVAVTKHNVNPTCVFQFIYKMVDVFRAYFGGAFDEENCRQNFVLIYELLDGQTQQQAKASRSPMWR